MRPSLGRLGRRTCRTRNAPGTRDVLGPCCKSTDSSSFSSSVISSSCKRQEGSIQFSSAELLFQPLIRILQIKQTLYNGEGAITHNETKGYVLTWGLVIRTPNKNGEWIEDWSIRQSIKAVAQAQRPII